MAVRRLHPEQPASFTFTPENLAWAKARIAQYPPGKQASAVIPLLWRAQEQEGWTTEPAIRAVADMLGMAYIRVYEIATFYTMFQLSPVGKKAHFQVCGTTPCMLRGAGDLIKICHERIGEQFEVTPDGKLSWVEVECLGACVNAPMVMIGHDTYEDLTRERFEEIVTAFAEGRGGDIPPGPQIDRQLSAPVGGPTTLTDPTLYANGRRPGAGTHQHGGPAMADSSAKRPGEAGNQRDAGVPQPPVGDKSAESPPGSRRE